MPTMKEVAVELLGVAIDGDLTTDLLNSEKDRHHDNKLYLGKIGRYEVWRNSSGFGVWVGEETRYGWFEKAMDAIEHARELNARDQEENRRYLALRKLPLLVKSITE